MATNHTAKEANVTPLINELVQAINTANSGLSKAEFGLSKRDNAAVASLAAGIIQVSCFDSSTAHSTNATLKDISTTMNVVNTEAVIFIPGLAGLLISIDVALHELLVTLGFLVFGVLNLIGGLCVSNTIYGAHPS